MKSLCQAIIWSACFLELSEDAVDPDAAVKALEDIASALQSATDDEKRAFTAECAAEADRLQDQAVYAATADFIRNLPSAFGLLGECSDL